MSFSHEDPVVSSSRKEALGVLAVTGTALTYTVVVCYRLGFNPTEPQPKFVRLFAGIAFPEWVFWGIVVPWIASFLIGALFAFRWMSDANLGEELAEDDDLFGAAQPAVTTSQEGTHHAG